MTYDLLVYVANWPQPRVSAWDTLLKARAIENLAYTAGVNRVGPDPKGTVFSGHSAVIDPRGQTLWSGEEAETVETVVLEAAKLLEYRDKFPAFLDADKFRLED